MEPVVIICMILCLQEEINQVLAIPSMGQHGLIAGCGRKNLCQIVFSGAILLENLIKKTMS